jgi:uncharacterized protein YbjT (DUF2867 family)
MQTILGANGAIGSGLAKELTSYANKIRLVSRRPKKVNDHDFLYAADLTKQDEADEAVAGSEIVYLTVGLEYKTRVWQSSGPRSCAMLSMPVKSTSQSLYSSITCTCMILTT